MPADPDDCRERAQSCYTAAYFVLPKYVFEEPGRVLSDFAKDPNYAAKFFYVMACKVEGRDPPIDDARAVSGHSGSLNESFDYHVIQYPPFPPVDLTRLPPDEMMEALQNVVLAPYFSAILYSKGGGIAHYFVLGQSPDGRTTLREVTPQMNANLGPGCEPDLARFVALLSDRLRPGAAPLEPIAGVRRAPPAARRRWWQFWK